MLSKGRRLEFANVAKGDYTMDEYNEIGARLRELREASDYTIEELAKELELDPEVYASYEENGKDVPISVIYQIANMFKVDFTEICTGQSAKLDTYHLIRRGGGKVINRNPEYHFEDQVVGVKLEIGRAHV